MSASAGHLLAVHIPGCSGAVGWCCSRQLFVGRGSVDPRAGLLSASCWEEFSHEGVRGEPQPLCNGTWMWLNPAQIRWRFICFKRKLCSPWVQGLPLLFELPNTKCWVSDIELIQLGFVDKMMWWSGKIMVVCLERDPLWLSLLVCVIQDVSPI